MLATLALKDSKKLGSPQLTMLRMPQGNIELRPNPSLELTCIQSVRSKQTKMKDEAEFICRRLLHGENDFYDEQTKYWTCRVTKYFQRCYSRNSIFADEPLRVLRFVVAGASILGAVNTIPNIGTVSSFLDHCHDGQVLVTVLHCQMLNLLSFILLVPPLTTHQISTYV